MPTDGPYPCWKVEYLQDERGGWGASGDTLEAALVQLAEVVAKATERVRQAREATKEWYGEPD